MSRKTPISKTLRNLVWNSYVGEKIGEWRCICGTSIDTFQFEVAHIIPECENGPTTIDNLRPLCSSCNKSCGKQNMRSFFTKLGKNLGSCYKAIAGNSIKRPFPKI